MPTIPCPLTGAAATEEVAVPWSSSSQPVKAWVFNATVLGRPTNSGWDRSTPESIIITGKPGPGAIQSATPMCDGHHSDEESGSVNIPKNPPALPGFVPT